MDEPAYQSGLKLSKKHSKAAPYSAQAWQDLPEVTISEQEGVRYLHFGSPWIQGAMRIAKPYALELEYVQQMMAWWLFLEPTAGATLCQIGLGAAALTKFCYQQFPACEIWAVDLNSAVIHAAHQMFRLPLPDERLLVLQADGGDFIAQQQRNIEILQVDVYDEQARGPVLNSLAFYQACRNALSCPGIMVVNLFGDEKNLPNSLAALDTAFAGRVLQLAPASAGNVVAICFNGPRLEIGWESLYARALYLEQLHPWPVRRWLAGLRKMNPQLDSLLFAI